MSNSIPTASGQILCEVLDSKHKTLCVMPLDAALRQQLCHKWVATIVTDRHRILLTGSPELELPFIAPLAIGGSAEELAAELIAPLCFVVKNLSGIAAIKMKDGRLLELFKATVSANSLSARVGAKLESVLITDLPALKTRKMLSPLAALLTSLSL